MNNPLTENHLVEQPAKLLFKELGWTLVPAYEEVFGPGGTLGRDAKTEVVLVKQLSAALRRLNPGIKPDAMKAAVDQLTRNRAGMSLAAANRELYELIKEGVVVSRPNTETGGQVMERLRVIDWNNPHQNDFLLVSQMSITGALYTCRPDLIGFVNGLPWVVIELKKPGVSARTAFDENLTHYKAAISQLFWYNGLLMVSNGTESRVGSLTADWDRFFEWKRIAMEGEPRRVSLEVVIRGTCDPVRLLDLVENFTLFSEHKVGIVKILGQNHQFLGVNNAIASALEARRMKHGRGGVFWQTQGSGKSYSMVFFAQKILSRVPGDWTFVIVTDRTELDDQIAKTFKACGAVTESEGDVCHAQSGAHLRQLLAENHRYVFTLIHKFQGGEPLCDRQDVMVLVDEAHRSQYDTLALNMRAALPKAMFVAFTGTPLIAGEERTREVFGDYVSIYDFQQSVEDGATVPLFYENRTPELRLENPDLNDEVYQLIEESELDDDQERRLERELGRKYHLITRDDRLDTVAKDIVRHFLGRGFQGKAMVVSIDKATALKMYGKVREHWKTELDQVEGKLAAAKGYNSIATTEEKEELEQRLSVLKSTDMALIVSPEQNEIPKMAGLGLDIVSHRKRMGDERLDEKFKDPFDPLKLVFVCAMWITGFDAPTCSTIYLDKPMRNHTLMQTIARANRVYPDKQSGLIVDYANVFASLERALAIYGLGQPGVSPVQDKSKLVRQLRTAVQGAVDYCAKHGVNLAAKFDVASLEKAVNAVICPDRVRKDFQAHVRLVTALYKAVLPDLGVMEFIPKVRVLTMMVEMIKEKLGTKAADISVVMAEINSLLDESIAAEGFQIEESGEGYGRGGLIDLSAIDFEALARKFTKSDTKNIELERLKAAIEAHLNRIIQLNKTRTNYRDKFEDLIDEYNSGSRSIEELFKELLEFTRVLTEEQKRCVRESLTEEELAIFDLLTRPDPELSTEEKAEVKKVARQLLERVTEVLSHHWRNRVSERARVRVTIEKTLDEGLPRAFSKEIFETKCTKVFEHVFEVYGEKGQNIYRMI